MSDGTCVYCGKRGDLRPYARNGGLLCFPCMMDEPDRQIEAHEQLGILLDAIPGEAVVLTPDGPVAGNGGKNQ